MAKYQLLAKDETVVKDNIELTLEEVHSYEEDNDITGVLQYDSYDDGTDIFDVIGDDQFCLKQIAEVE